MYFVISPHYRFVHRPEDMAALKHFAANRHVRLWDYSRHADFSNDHSLFQDRLHLNDRGAEAHHRLYEIGRKAAVKQVKLEHLL